MLSVRAAAPPRPDAELLLLGLSHPGLSAGSGRGGLRRAAARSAPLPRHRPRPPSDSWTPKKDAQMPKNGADIFVVFWAVVPVFLGGCVSRQLRIALAPLLNRIGATRLTSLCSALHTSAQLSSAHLRRLRVSSSSWSGVSQSQVQGPGQGQGQGEGECRTNVGGV